MQPVDKKEQPPISKPSLPEIDGKAVSLALVTATIVGGIALASRGKINPSKVKDLSTLKPISNVVSRIFPSSVPASPSTTITPIISPLPKVIIPYLSPTPSQIKVPVTVLEPKTTSIISEIFTANLPATPSTLALNKIVLDVPKDHPLRALTTDRLVAHEADFLIKGTDLEGSTMAIMGNHRYASLSFFNKHGILSSQTDQKLITFFTNFEPVPSKQTVDERKALAQKIADKCLTLKIGESISTEGGWLEKKSNGSFGGHALIYTFTKVDNDLYDIYIYNTGSGTGQYHAKLVVTEGIKEETLICPYVKFQDVEAERLCLTENRAYPEFFERIIEIKQGLHPSESSALLYTSKDAFGAFLDKLVKPGPNTPYIPAQRAGTCTLSVLMARLRSEFSSEEEFNRYKLTSEFTHFTILFEKTPSLENNLSIKELLEKQGRNLLCALELQSHLFPKEEIVKATDKINEILDHITSISSEKLLISSYKPIEDQTKIAPKKLDFIITSPVNLEPKSITTIAHKELIFGSLTVQDIQDHLTKILQIQDPKTKIFAIEKLARNSLLFSKKELDKIPLSEVPGLIEGLHTALSSYINTHNREFIQSQVPRNTAWALVATTYDLACRIVPPLTDFGIDHKILKADDTGELHIEFSKKERKVLKKILIRLDEQDQKPQIFNLADYNGLSKNSPQPPEMKWLINTAYPGEKPPLSFEDQCNILFKNDLFKGIEGTTIVRFRDMVYFAYLSCPSMNLKIKDNFKPVHDSFHYTTSNNRLYTLDFLHYSFFKWRKLWKRPDDNAYHFSTFEKENVVLSNPAPYKSGDIPPFIICNQSLRCSKLLYFYSNNYVKLQDPITQEMFFQFLFQSTPTGDPPIFKAIQDKAFAKQLTKFLEKGSHFFFEAKLIGKPDVTSCLFFARLARRISELDPALSYPSFQDKINTYLITPDLTDAERKLSHLHRILQYKGSAMDNLSNNQLQEISTSWILCKSHVFSDVGDGRFQKEEAFRFLLSLAPKLTSLPSESLDQIIEGALLGEKIEKGPWTPSAYPTYTKGPWSINLVNGEIFKEGVLRECGAYKDLSEFPLYVRVFGDMKPHQTKRGDTYEFTDDKTKQLFRYLEQDKKTLQVFFQGTWYEYHRPDDFNETLIFPSFLLSNHHCFASGKARVFVEKASRKIAFTITENGDLIDHLNKSKIAYQNQVKTQDLDNFEQPGWRIHDEKKKIRFPRFTTATGNEFSLILNQKGDFILEENPGDFTLIPPIEGILGLLKNTLCFQNPKTNDIKILVPIKPIEKQETLAPIGTLSNPEPPLLYRTYEDLRSQEKIYSIAEYTYKKGKIIPKDRTSKALLSYLYLSQKKELEALIFLESLGRERALDPKTAEIVSWIYMTPSKFSNKTPAAVAVALEAGLLLSRTKDNVDLTPLITLYRDTYDNIPAELKLLPRDIKEINILHPDKAIPIGKKIQISKKAVLAPQEKAKPILIGSLSYSTTKESLTTFNALYTKLKEASTEKEKELLLARTTFENLPDTLQAILLLAKTHSFPPLPSLSEITDKYDKIRTIDAWIRTFPSNSKSYSPPSPGEAPDNTSSIPSGTPLRSLSEALAEIKAPSISSSPIVPIRETPLLNLQALFIKPYFTEIKPLGQPKIAPLQVPKIVPPLYAKPIERAIKEANEEIALGQTINENVSSFLLKKEASLDTVRQELTDRLTKIQDSLAKAKEKILNLAKTDPEDALLAEKASRLEKGKALPEIVFEQLINHYLKGSYEDLNPHLREDQLTNLDLRIKEFLTHATQAQQIERALDEKNPVLIGQTLHAEMAYTPSSNKAERVFLVYEYRANLRIRPEQISSIRAMLSSPYMTLQMLMGGGKTTVLTSILLEMVEPGKIAFFIPPAAQFETQVANLSEMQHKYYSKHITYLNLERIELTVSKLEELTHKLQAAIDYQQAVVATASTLESLQLEWFSLLDKNPSGLSEDEQKKIPLLRGLLRTLKKDGSFLLDEVDQILDLRKELNFPIGDKEPISPTYVNLIKKIFRLHLSPDIESKLSLLQGRQSSFPKDEYKQKILPKIADALFDQCKTDFGLEDSQKEPFLALILEGKEHTDLRTFLESRIANKDPKIAESAQLVFLVKGLFSTILPSIMGQSENKNFGIPNGDVKRKVIPFLGVDSPASTEVANPYELICLRNLTALNPSYTQAQLHNLASKFIESAAPLVEYEGALLQDTTEYKTFLHLTGAPLDKIYNKDPIITQNTLTLLNGDEEKRLELEKEFIRLNKVGAYTSYYQSNPLNFCGLVSSVKALTGTPWNRMTYIKELRENTRLEKGTEGRIRSVFIQRSDKGDMQIHFTPTNDVKKTLEISLKNNPRKKRFRALLDPIGFFKDKPNEAITREILSYFQKDPTVESALFFGRVDGNMGIPGTLKVLRKSEEQKHNLEIIGSTEKEVLSAKGLNPETTIPYFDERHCEATDLPLPEDALGLVTVNSKLLDRDLLQTNFRLRGYLKKQDVDLILPESERANYPENVTGRDILTQALIAQEIKSADEGFSSFSKQIDNIFKQRAYELLLEDGTHETFQKMRDVFVVKQDLSPYALFGKVSKLESPLDVFLSYRKEKEDQFSYLSDEEIKNKLDSLQDELENKLDHFPSKVQFGEAAHGMQMELSLQTETQVQTELETELEHQFYQKTGLGTPFKEKEGPKISTISKTLQDTKVEYKKPYASLFEDSALVVSENFVYTETHLLPIFSKKQKPAYQILIRKSLLQGVKATLISAAEADLIKQKIENGLGNTWLYLPDGEMHVEPSSGSLEGHSEFLSKILLDVNILNGNVLYLLEHKKEVITKFQNNPKLRDLLLHFLAVKTVENPSQKGALERLSLELSVIH